MNRKDNHNLFWIFLRKYKIVIGIFVSIPLLLSVACYFSIPYFNNAGSAAWLGFWGGYLGSAIMAGVTLYVLDKQLSQNHEENDKNRKDNITENKSNRALSSNLRLQEIEIRWFEDLKLACIKLYSAFNNDDVVLVSDLDPLTEQFNEKVSQMLTRMNETYFNFQLVVNYHKNIANKEEVMKIQHYVKEYLSLLSDMNSLFVYGLVLKDGLNNIDLTPEELNSQYRGYILKHKKNMEIPEIKENRIWDLLIDDRFDKIEYLSEVLGILRKRIDHFHMVKVGTSITELVKAEYKKANGIILNGTE